MRKALIELKNITKTFEDGNTVLDDFSLRINENEFITLLGPSGCGKTTTLRVVGGFERPDSGRVFFEGRDITDMPPNKRPINTVFQKYALFPHMNVGDNIAFGLRVSGKSESFIRDKVRETLKMVNLSGFQKRRISSLSGGQQQRVAMARAIVNEPKLLLLDEPLGALDLKLREEMAYELIRLKNELGITFLYVTHDQEEALTMSDKVVVMNGGYIQQMGTPEEIYNEPQNAFVADFIGDSNITDGAMVRDREVRRCGRDVIIGKPGEGALDGVVSHNVFIGVHYEMEIQAGGFEWLVQNTVSYVPGTRVSIDVLPENIQIMHKPTRAEEEAMYKDV